MATKKVVKPALKKAVKPVAKKVTAIRGNNTPARVVRKALPAPRKASFEGMVEEVEETSVPKSNLAVYSDKPTMDSNDLFIPRLRLAQGLTKEVQDGEAKPGQWLVLGAEPAAEVTVIPVAMTRRRELRDPDERTVACRSGDSITGVGNPGGECSSCPMNQWTPTKSGKNNPPACSFLYSYMVWVIEAETMAILEFSRTSITTGKMINTMVAQRGLGTFCAKLTSSSKQGPKGTFYSPVVSMSAAKTEDFKRALAESQSVR